MTGLKIILQLCTDSDCVYSNPDDDEPIISFEGVGLGKSYSGQFGFVYRCTRYGSYFNPAGEEVFREMIRDHPDKASRESPVLRKKGKQLRYLKIGPGYSVDPRFDRFRYTEVQFINFIR